MRFTSIEDFVGKKDLFYSRYFDREPHIFKAAIPGPLDDIFSIADLDEALNFEALRSDYMILAKQGELIPSHRYSRTIQVRDTPQVTYHNCVDPEKVRRLFHDGATIFWTGVNHFNSTVRRISEIFAEELGVRVEGDIFLTPARTQGFVIHHDPFDTYIVQLSGTKNWKVWPTPEERPKQWVSYDQKDMPEPVIEESLQPGDVLYIPYGTPHGPVAEEDTSLHMTFSAPPVMWSDKLESLVNAILQGDAEFRDRRYIFGRGEATDQSVEQAAEALIRKIREAEGKKEILDRSSSDASIGSKMTSLFQ
ncbi:JmjC domain-containing protein [Streptomyces sp. NPDC059534]|uniref:JmjC domain-containing protein n=1 Tax=Streptomyces sp. NPDC059534 TaxID=3346859 RepID=UPI00367497B1